MQPPCSRVISSEDQHGKCVRCVVLAHARDDIFGCSSCKYIENFTLKSLYARLAFFARESAVLPCRAALDASLLREAAAWSSEAELEAMESEQFSLSGITAQILWSSFLWVVLHPARRHGMPFPSCWRIFDIPRPPTLRTLGPHHLTFYMSSPADTELVEVLARD